MTAFKRGVSLRFVTFSGVLLTATAAVLGQAAKPPAASRPSSRPDMTAIVAKGSRVHREVAYVEHAAAQQKLDIYAPPGGRQMPVVMFVHGGEWTKGDKSEVSYKPRLLNENGIIFVSINYRLSGVAKHPAQAEDVAAAVRWTRDHIADYDGDPARLFLMGHSAGCHLVTLVGLDRRPLDKVGMKPADLRGVISWSGGAFDLVEKVRDGGMYADYIRTNFGPDEKTWRDASPMTHIGDARPMPRFLFASAENDKPASREASRRMVTMIHDAGGDSAGALLPGKNHTTANHEIGAPGDKSAEVLLNFVRSSAAASPARRTAD